MVHSRAFTLPVIAEEHYAPYVMMPYMDMINHHYRYQVLLLISVNPIKSWVFLLIVRILDASQKASWSSHVLPLLYGRLTGSHNQYGGASLRSLQDEIFERVKNCLHLLVLEPMIISTFTMVLPLCPLIFWVV